jgi:16S rRNA (guanine966-N2)-methyltransferase
MRITGGTHRSRALVAPRGQATRPTSDRVREALFSILGARTTLDGARVLDLYAGTGALALEALSRGAERATVVEKGREALAAIRTNVAALKVEGQVEVLALPVERASEKLAEGKFDLVFVDPPYAEVSDGSALRAVERVAAVGAFAPDALVVLEHAPARGQARASAPEEEERGPEIAGLRRDETRRYGDTCLSFYVVTEPGRTPMREGA